METDKERISLGCPLEHGSVSVSAPAHRLSNAEPSRSFLFLTNEPSSIYSVFSGIATKLDTIGSKYLIVLASDSMFSSYYGDFDPSGFELGKHYGRGEVLSKMGKGKELILGIWWGKNQLYEEVEFDCSH